MYQTTRMSGYSRALAIILGLFTIGVGITAIFFPSIVVGFLTILFAISFILMGLWALSIGLSGQRVTMRTSQGATQGAPENKVRDQVPA